MQQLPSAAMMSIAAEHSQRAADIEKQVCVTTRASISSAFERSVHIGEGRLLRRLRGVPVGVLCTRLTRLLTC